MAHSAGHLHWAKLKLCYWPLALWLQVWWINPVSTRILPEPTRQSLCCLQQKQGHTKLKWIKKNRSRPEHEPRTPRRPCKHPATELTSHMVDPWHLSRRITIRKFYDLFRTTMGSWDHCHHSLRVYLKNDNLILNVSMLPAGACLLGRAN